MARNNDPEQARLKSRKGATKRPVARRPRKTVVVDESPPAEAEDRPPAAADASKGAAALIRAGLKALGDVRGDLVARQTRVFELLLGIGQSADWRQASPSTAQPADPFGKFESVFDERVARSLDRLGFPSAQELRDLSERVRALTEALNAAEPKRRRR